MFCPICKAEYRSGFARCSDCQVELVEKLDDTISPAIAQDRPGSEILWTGMDSGLRDAICEGLDDARIFYYKRSRDVGPLPGLTAAVYGVVVHGRDLDAAKAVLEDVRRELAMGAPAKNSSDRGTSAVELTEPEGETSEATPDDIVSNFRPGGATAEVWVGDPESAEMVRVCLRENGVGCVLADSDGKRRVRVMPEAETRAKEIIREILEGTPPN